MSFETEAFDRINFLQNQITALAQLLDVREGRQQAQHWLLQALITTHPQPQLVAEKLLEASDKLVAMGHADVGDQHWYKPLQEYAQLAAHTSALRAPS